MICRQRKIQVQRAPKYTFPKMNMHKHKLWIWDFISKLCTYNMYQGLKICSSCIYSLIQLMAFTSHIHAYERLIFHLDLRLTNFLASVRINVVHWYPLEKGETSITDLYTFYCQNGPGEQPQTEGWLRNLIRQFNDRVPSNSSPSLTVVLCISFKDTRESRTPREWRHCQVELYRPPTTRLLSLLRGENSNSARFRIQVRSIATWLMFISLINDGNNYTRANRPVSRTHILRTLTRNPKHGNQLFRALNPQSKSIKMWNKANQFQPRPYWKQPKLTWVKHFLTNISYDFQEKLIGQIHSRYKIDLNPKWLKTETKPHQVPSHIHNLIK